MADDGGMVLRLTGTEAALNAASNSTVSNASFVRILNAGAAAALVTQVTASGNLTITIAGSGGELFINKKPSDTLFSSANTLAAPVKRF
jgi:hypothetical protein